MECLDKNPGHGMEGPNIAMEGPRILRAYENTGHTHTHTALNLLSVYMSCSLCLEGLKDDFPPCGRGSAQVWSLNADD